MRLYGTIVLGHHAQGNTWLRLNNINSTFMGLNTWNHLNAERERGREGGRETEKMGGDQ